MALPAALVSALGFGLPVVAVATGAVLFATAGPVASPGGVGVATVWLDSPHEASVLAAGEVPVVVHATADRAPTSLVLVVDGVVVGERPAGAPVLGRLVEAIIPWQATVGPHTLQARAGDLASPIVPVVVVSPSGSAPTAAPTAVPTLSGPTSTATAVPTAATPPTTATKPSTTRPPATSPTTSPPTTKPSTSTVVPAPVVTSVTLSPTAVDVAPGCLTAVMGISAKVTGSVTSVKFTWVAGTTSGSGSLTNAGSGTWTGSINFGALSQPADMGPVTITVTATNPTGSGTRQAAGTIVNCKP